ncbi:MAG: sigma-70 family RNA polymerase sigma factor [Planctomycetes bacterium]|nr:sigma-70 family RNA polymerase sigma factor [Planctomycetota bacterium]
MNKKNFGDIPAGVRPSAPSRAPLHRGARDLFRSELEIPVKKLLTHKEELAGARRIGLCMIRLGQILPRHPVGFVRFLRRMEEVTNDVHAFFPWHALRDDMEKDLAAARRALARAEGQATRSPESAVRTYEKAVEILLKYPLDPETLYQWGKEVSESSLPDRELWRHRRFAKVQRLLRRIVFAIDRERDRLVMPNLRLVLREVFRFPAKGMYESDLFQEGFLGLSKAVFRFDPERNLRFSTYATHWIRQSIRKALIDKSSLIRLPQALHEKRYRRHRKLTDEQLERIHKLRSNMVMFSSMSAEEDDSTYEVTDPRAVGVSPSLQTEDIPRAVHKALARLSDAERDVVSRRFGLDGNHRQTLEEIGAQMHLSRERIRQIERSALEQMREVKELWETYEDLTLLEPAGVN